jgi:flagellar biosynthesis anti-sigma factor FlgM
VNVNKKRFLEVLEAAPELRKAKIAVLKKAITEGAYKVKAEDIAEKILKEWLFELTLTLPK